MTDKKICYFKGDDNKVMIQDLKSEQWSEKTIDEPGFKFKNYAAAVTLPNGDCLIIGGEGSNAVY